MNSTSHPIPNNVAGYDPTKNADDYYYDHEAGERPILFCERILTHVKGALARKPLVLESWQKDFIRTLFGWKHKVTHLRRYRFAILEVARGNGKTTLAALVGLYCLLADGELGPEVYLAATTKEQSSILFDIIAGMRKQSAVLTGKTKCLDARKKLLYPSVNGSLTAIVGGHEQANGYSCSCAIYDELHCAPNRKLFDVLWTSQGKRQQPIYLVISTSGSDRHSIMYEKHDYGCKVRDGIIDDPTCLPAIYSAPSDLPYDLETTWTLANPNLGVSVTLDYLRTECKHAKELPAYTNSFRRDYLCQWTENETNWLPVHHWGECRGEFPPLTVPCFGGLDLSSTADLSALNLSWIIENKLYTKTWFWIPEARLQDREDRDRVPYSQWKNDPTCQLTLTPGNVIDYQFIEHRIKELAHQYKITSIFYDRYNSHSIVNNLTQEGIQMNPFGQGFVSMNSPAKELEKRVLEHSLVNDNPVLSWCAANVSIVTDPAGNIKPCKPEHQDHRRVDGIIALCMSIAGHLGEQQNGIYSAPVLWI